MYIQEELTNEIDIRETSFGFFKRNILSEVESITTIEDYLCNHPNLIKPILDKLNNIKRINTGNYKLDSINYNVNVKMRKDMIKRIENNPDIQNTLSASDLGLFYKD